MTIYNDIDLKFEIDPITKDFSRLEDDEAVKQAVKNVVLVAHEEKLNNPIFGTIVPKAHFGNFNFFTAFNLQQSIKFALANYEPRISEVKVTVIPNQQFHEVHIGVHFKILATNKVAFIGVLLDRGR